MTRLLHADGVGLDALGVGQGPLSEQQSRSAWRLLCERWELFRGTPVRFWLEAELAGIFGVTARPSKQTADAIYDQVAERLGQDAYRPRALFDRFRIRSSRPPTTPALTWRRTPRWPPTRRGRDA